MSALEKQAKTKSKEQTRVDQLRASLAAKESERNTMEARLNDTRTLDELKEQEAELQRQNEEDQAVIDNEDASTSDKQAADGRVAERQEDIARLRTQIDERERALPLRERVKEIFKKYGVTVTAIALAAGVTIGAVIGAITNGLKATGKVLGKGLKDVGSKVASALPGLIGSIVSFLFKAAGQAIGFLAEHTWLLILAVVAFLVEKIHQEAALAHNGVNKSRSPDSGNSNSCFVIFVCFSAATCICYWLIRCFSLQSPAPFRALLPCVSGLRGGCLVGLSLMALLPLALALLFLC